MSSLSITTNDGVKLAYSKTGENGPNVLLIHGWSGSRQYFRDSVQDLAKQCQVYAYDLRGHGDSDKPTVVKLPPLIDTWISFGNPGSFDTGSVRICLGFVESSTFEDPLRTVISAMTMRGLTSLSLFLSGVLMSLAWRETFETF
ncbi:hypothetical protein CYMTET_25875 [Cymbomonas tetramitiformis]|uniref:AB hydrolase-1 domain-containing protein n=1 Tax=Cymbomonas tetramitiformis TaxID=36881 RepID=A0AAE0FSZ4_9CHLO|nr:hypothetical protein CYMTET_25875 [Cymbomonas tetramitiformis]